MNNASFLVSQSCDWNEAVFQEAMNRAIDGVAATAETLLVA